MHFLIRNGFNNVANIKQEFVHQLIRNKRFLNNKTQMNYNFYKWEGLDEDQKYYLSKLNFNNIDKWTKESTAELIKVIYNNNDIVPSWINSETFVPKIDSLQTKILRELGFNNLDKMSNITGSEIIDVLSKNNWDVNKLPYPINTYGNYNKEQCCLHKYVKKTKDDLEERLGFNNKKENNLKENSNNNFQQKVHLIKKRE